MVTRTRNDRLFFVAVAGLFCCTTSTTLAGEEVARPPSVRASFADKTAVFRHEAITLTLDRPLRPADGRLSVFLDQTDLTPLFTVDELALGSTPARLMLPAGKGTLTVYLFAPDETWRQLATFSVTVEEAPAPPSGTPGETREPAWSARVQPSLSLNLAQQLTVRSHPDTDAPERAAFTDYSMQAGLQAGVAHRLVSAQAQVDLVGFSYRPQALRYGELGDRAPRIDMSSYLVQLDVMKVKAQLGHASFGSHRFLVNSFASRGLTLTVPIGRVADVSLAGMSGTSVVGWSHIFGLDRRQHRVYGGTLGLEVLPGRPGGIRLEISAVDGSLLPLSSYTRRTLDDAEKSRGFGARLVASDPSQRLRLEAGFARSRFTNPADPLLESGGEAVAVRATTATAQYLDASYEVLRNAAVSKQRTANLALAVRYSRVDPLYRSVAVYSQADRFDLQSELTGGIGDIQLAGGYAIGHDNLASVPSLLRTETRRGRGQVTIPLSSAFGSAGRLGSLLLPRIGYSYERTHQYGASIPVNGGFDESSVPDQVSENHNLTADWQVSSVRLGYRHNRSFQDNRQPGRAQADLKNVVNGVTLGTPIAAVLDVSLDLTSERSHNFETDARYQIWRGTAGFRLQTSARSSLAVSLGTTLEGDVAKANESRNLDVDAQWSAGFSRESRPKVDAQFFVRYAQRYARSFDNVFFSESMRKLQTMNTGLKLSFF